MLLVFNVRSLTLRILDKQMKYDFITCFSAQLMHNVNVFDIKLNTCECSCFFPACHNHNVGKKQLSKTINKSKIV